MIRDIVKFLTLQAVVLSGLWFLGKRVSLYPDYQHYMNFTFAHAADVQALAVGDSANISLDYNSLGMRGFDGWLGGADYYEAQWQVETLMPRLPKLKYVFLAIDLPQIDELNFALTGKTSQRKAAWELYYSAYPGAGPAAGDLGNYLWTYIFGPLVRPNHWEYVVENIARSFVPAEGRTAERSVASVPEHPLRVANVERPGLSKDDLVSQCNDSAYDPNPVQEKKEFVFNSKIADANYEIMSRIAEDVGSRGVELVIYTPPTYERRIELLSAVELKQARELMKKLDERYDSAVYIDFSRDQIAKSAEYFSDCMHLTADGAKAMSAKLKDLLQKQL